MLIGITGETGSGKTTLANILSNKYGYEVIHGDEVAHEVLTLEKFNEVLSWFELPPHDKVDRKYLGHLLFSIDDARKRYDAYIYPYIKERLDQIMRTSDNTNFVIDWNFLPKTSLKDECDITILMKCGEYLRRERVKMRDNIDDDYFTKRNNACLKYCDEDYDFVFVNESEYALEESIKKHLEGLLWK
ncbi:MAG: dephospho-CoA kinase [Bacilli bacterium]|nr:dephospho-CoA kinase [Bacilli bacterium]MDE6142424.1 dephospho-CoA kinase [Bacilli bacterium]